MKRPATLLLPLLVSVAVHAQVDVDLILDREFFLPAEAISVGVRIANFSGGPLTLGNDPGWLQFSVEETNGRVVSRLADPEESGEFTLEQSTRGTMKWNITPMFAINDPGMYRVFGAVRLPSGEIVTTEPVGFQIVAGVKLNEPREVGVKLPDGTQERRKFILQQVNFLKRVQLYLRITDPSESHTYAITALGPYVSFDRPQWLVDRETRFHVLHRTDGQHYSHHVFLGDGTLAQRQVWVRTDARPELGVNAEGEVRVLRGVRRPTAADLPAPTAESATATNAPTPVAPLVTGSEPKPE